MYEVKFVGLRETIQKFEKLNVQARIIKFDTAAHKVQRVARRLAPTLTGALRRSIRVLPKRLGSIIEAGAGLMPYAAVQERGRYHNIQGKFYMRRASQTNVANAAARDVAKIIRKSF